MNDFNYRKEYLRYITWTLLGLSIIVCLEWNRVDVSTLFDSDGQYNAISLLSGFSNPDFSPEFLKRIFKLSFESLFVGILGTVFAVILGTTLAFVAMRIPPLPDPPGKKITVLSVLGWAIRWLSRFLMGFFRSVPEVVWAYLFVRMLGLGPGAAVLAIGLTVGGTIGKLYAELGEACDAKLVGGLRASGASRLAIILFGIVPQVSRQWIAYALFRMECNIRTGTILGVVGAGGLGSEIALSIRYFEFDKLATALIAVLVFVIGLELLSAWFRTKPMRFALGFGLVGALVSLFALDIPWIDLFREAQLLPSIGTFSFSENFIWTTLRLIAETISMAWVATLIAALIAFFLAPLTTRHLMTSTYLKGSYPVKGMALVWRSIGLWCTRFFLQITRAMPELTLALVFVVWVGPGVFAGILAIAIHNIGVIGRLFTDVYEEVETGPVQSLQASGASNLGVWAYGILPQVFPRLIAFTLYRFEVNIRATAMVGFVGAGGIGNSLHTAISLFQTADLMVLLLVMLVVVTFTDNIGDSIRHRILTGKTQTSIVSFFVSKIKFGQRKRISETQRRFPECCQFAYNEPGQATLRAASPTELAGDTLTITVMDSCPQCLIIDLHLRNNDQYSHAQAKVISCISTSDLSDKKNLALKLINPSKAFTTGLSQFFIGTEDFIGAPHSVGESLTAS